MEKVKQKILKNLQNTCCRLKPSKIDGIGVFAFKNILKGKDPFYGTNLGKWYKFLPSELKRVDKPVLKMVDDFFAREKDDSIYIPENGLNGIDISFFLNSSKSPSLKIVANKKSGITSFVTTRKIKSGEELTISYEDFEGI